MGPSASGVVLVGRSRSHRGQDEGAWEKPLSSWPELSLCFPRGSVGKESACSAGDRGKITGSGRSPGEGNGYPLQYSCLGNPLDRGASRASVRIRSQELDTT